MTPWTAQRLGGIVGAALAIAVVIWLRVRATPCPGAVTLEFHPPLADPGNYYFRLAGPRLACEFSVSLPQAAPPPHARNCNMARELRTQVRDGQVSINELTFAAAPEHFTLQVKRDAETIYDAALEPNYAPYPTARAENKHFCGARARGAQLPPRQLRVPAVSNELRGARGLHERAGVLPHARLGSRLWSQNSERVRHTEQLFRALRAAGVPRRR